jgi:hypothetical protein
VGTIKAASDELARCEYTDSLHGVRLQVLHMVASQLHVCIVQGVSLCKKNVLHTATGLIPVSVTLHSREMWCVFTALSALGSMQNRVHFKQVWRSEQPIRSVFVYCMFKKVSLVVNVPYVKAHRLTNMTYIMTDVENEDTTVIKISVTTNQHGTASQNI